MVTTVGFVKDSNKVERTKTVIDQIIDFLKELDFNKSIKFRIVNSMSVSSCMEILGEFKTLPEFLSILLKELENKEGYCIYTSDHKWDFIESNKEDQFYNSNEIFIKSKMFELFFNPYAVCENQQPVVILKKDFVDKVGKSQLSEYLKFCEVGEDYTAKISPAVYIELYYD